MRVAAPVLLGALALGGCAVGPDFSRPPPPAVKQYRYEGDPASTVPARQISQVLIAGGRVDSEWWRLFGAPQLDAVVREALRRNPQVEVAAANLRESNDALRSGYGIFFPQAEIGAAASRQRYAPAKIGEDAPATIFNLFTLSASVSYALDVFGGQRRQVEQLHAQVDLARASADATYVTLIGNVVTTAIASAAYRAEIQATQHLIGVQREQRQLAQLQADAGTAPYATVLALDAQLAANEAIVPQLQGKLAQSEHLLASLAGHVPAEWKAPQVDLSDLSLPSQLPVSLPSELVRQRPDVRVAEAAAHAACAQVGVSTAALFPSVSIGADYSANGSKTSTVTALGGRAWDLGASLTQPVFEGGTLWYRRKASVDAYQSAMASYRQVVIGAFSQVADILSALEYDALTVRAEDRALEAAGEALRLVQINYQAGLVTYLDVLNADAQYQSAMVNDLQAVAVRYQDTVGLFVALGGGTGDPAEGPAGPQEQGGTAVAESAQVSRAEQH